MKLSLIIVAVLLLAVAPRNAASYTSASKHLEESDDWYRGDQAKQMAESVLTYQTSAGDWPKNIDTATQPYTGDRAKLHGTFDNGATTFELRFLARISNVTGEKRYQDAFLKGLDHILAAQYANGGWPQSSPPGDGYDRYITYNDGAMGRLMFFIRDVAKDDKIYTFVNRDRRDKCKAAWDKGVECILNTQVKVDGKLTVWCAQHDEKNLEPRPARDFEPLSLSGSESIGLVHVLMNVETPDARVVAAMHGARDWFDAVKIHGIRVEDRPQEGTPKGFERFVIKDPSAEPMWARFYEIGTNRPIFSDRDKVVKYDLSEIGVERRTGYRWLGTWPKNFLEKEYPEWKEKLAVQGSK